MRFTLAATILATFVLAGCGEYQPAPLPTTPQAAAQKAQGPAAPRPAASEPQSGMTLGMTGIGAAAGLAPLDAMGGPQGVAPARSPAPPSGYIMPQPPAPPPGYQKAEVGVGAKGRGYNPGLITTPIAAYFSARERIAFLTVEHTLKLYKAANGNAPRTHEEFMERIIKENGIKLPELPAGERYIYLPDQEQLMVEHPQR